MARFIDWWIDPETGYADESRCGKLRYFIRRNNIIHWADTPQQLYDEFHLYSPEEMEEVKSRIVHQCEADGQRGYDETRPRLHRRTESHV